MNLFLATLKKLAYSYFISFSLLEFLIFLAFRHETICENISFIICKTISFINYASISAAFLILHF